MIGDAGAVAWPSENCGDRRGGQTPSLVVLHYTAMKSAEAARDWLCNPEAQVSAHYVVAEDGRLWQLVCEGRRAWHAGAGSWQGRADVNSRSIGIEIANTGFHPFPEPQMARVETLLRGIFTRWNLTPEAVLGHSDMAIGRKIDPGPRFDWNRLARQELSIWPGRSAPGDFEADARRFGYGWKPGQEDALLSAFRMRFCPGASGPLNEADRAVMADLARRWPAPA
ncbi:N-acetylmuramoyl-L-alanine amidase [Pacificoceanicola onchidii]|uniref:N-acetylmuramoyl-L-alanine amidase n=1 Tax=Pacificoceanicola onchidii TaxID=2562685 RepID=UPI001F0DE6CE|nr:N-acetylmuramoyl-L-alanine amidase [Pacificoceanicola onchidii]